MISKREVYEIKTIDGESVKVLGTLTLKDNGNYSVKLSGYGDADMTIAEIQQLAQGLLEIVYEKTNKKSKKTNIDRTEQLENDI